MSVETRESFVEKHLSELLRTAYLLTGNQQDAEDLAQDVLLKVHRHWRQVHGSDDPVRYVHRILINQFLDERRRKRVATRPLDLLPSEPANGSDDLGHIDDHALLGDLLQQLAPRERLTVILHFYADRSVAEIATHMAVTQSTVRANLSRAMRHLRAALPADEQYTSRSSPRSER